MSLMHLLRCKKKKKGILNLQQDFFLFVGKYLLKTYDAIIIGLNYVFDLIRYQFLPTIFKTTNPV